MSNSITDIVNKFNPMYKTIWLAIILHYLPHFIFIIKGK